MSIVKKKVDPSQITHAPACPEDTEKTTYESEISRIFAELNRIQEQTAKRLQRGRDFLVMMERPTLPPSLSAAGALEKFEMFSGRYMNDTAWLALAEYIEGEKGKGDAYKWLHARLDSLVFGDGNNTPFDVDNSTGCILLILRYVRATPQMIEVAEKMAERTRDHETDSESDSDDRPPFNWRRACKEFFAALDNDPFWAENPLSE